MFCREGSYAGSRSSFQGPVGGDPNHGRDPHHSSTYADPYSQEAPRYNGGVHYPEDTYGQQGDDYGHQANQPYVDHSGGEGSVYPGEQPSFIDNPPQNFHEDPRYNPDVYDQDPHSNSFRQSNNVSQGPSEHYPDELNPHNYPQQGDSFQELPPQHNSYQSQGHPYGSNQYIQGDPTSQHSDPYLEQDRHSEAPRDRRSFDQPSFYPEQTPHQGDSNNPEDNYFDDSHRRYDGLPPVRADPFADDPFREANNRDASRLGPPEDPYYGGGSPAGGSDVYYSYFYGNMILSLF